MDVDPSSNEFQAQDPSSSSSQYHRPFSAVEVLQPKDHEHFLFQRPVVTFQLVRLQNYHVHENLLELQDDVGLENLLGDYDLEERYLAVMLQC